jgi:hypothetical protein
LLSTPVAVFGAFGVLLLRRLFIRPFTRHTWSTWKTTCIRKSVW